MEAENLRHDQFVALLASNTKKLYAFIRTLVLNDENDAEEIFQITCLILWRKFDKYDPEGDFGAWACRIAYFEILRQREERRHIRLMSEQALAALADAALPISRKVNERREALAECITKLDAKDLRLVRTRYFDGMRVNDIAEQTGRSIYAIYRDISRVNAQLLRCVQRKIDLEVDS